MQSDTAKAWLEYGRSYALHPSLWDGSLECAFGPLFAEGATLRDRSYRTAGAVWSVGAGDTPKYVQSSVRGGSFVAGQYDGTDDYAECVIPNATGKTIAVSCWVNMDAVASAQSIATRHSSASLGWLLQKSATHQILWTVYDGSTPYTATSDAQATGTWVHACGIYDGATVYVLVNGTQSGTTASNTAAVPNSTRQFQIGARFTSVLDRYLSGKVASLSVMYRVPTQSEISILAQHPLAAYETVRPRYWMFGATTHLWPWQIRRSRRMRGKR